MLISKSRLRCPQPCATEQFGSNFNPVVFFDCCTNNYRLFQHRYYYQFHLHFDPHHRFDFIQYTGPNSYTNSDSYTYSNSYTYTYSNT
jgi:hypothetical protein